jgi:hypothetical protein
MTTLARRPPRQLIKRKIFAAVTASPESLAGKT